MNVERVHRALEQILQTVSLTGEQRRDVYRRLAAANEDESRSREVARAAIRSELLVLRQRESHLTPAFTEGLLTDDEHREALGSVQNQRTQLEKRASGITDVSGDRLAQLRASIARAHTAWDLFILFAVSEQRQLLDVVFDRIEISHTGLTRYDLKSYAIRTAAA